MPYTPNPDDATQPTDAVSAETAQAEFRALKNKVNGVALGGGSKNTFRQGVLDCAMNVDVAAFLAAASNNLSVKLLASTTAFLLTFAVGFNNNGQVDYGASIGADQDNYWVVPANNNSFLSIDNSGNSIVTTGNFNVGSNIITGIPTTANMSVGMNISGVNIQNNTVITSVDSLAQVHMSNNAIGANLPVIGAAFTATGTLAPTSTLAPPQHGRIYDRTRQAVLQFGGVVGSVVFLDDFGNAWNASGGAKVQTNSFKFGSGGLGGGGAANALNGTTDFVATADITTLGPEGWALRCWANTSSLPGVGVSNVIFQAVNAAGFGTQVQISNNAGVIKFNLYISSDGVSWNLASAAASVTTPVIGTWYFLELTYDSASSTYRLYVNGTQEIATVNGARVCGIINMCVGSTNGSASGFNGYIDKFEFLPYCQRPAGTAYAVPTAAPSIIAAGYASDWFDLINYLMWKVSAVSTVRSTNPTFTNIIRVYVGEVSMGATVPNSFGAYQPRGEFISSWISPLPAVATNIIKNDFIGSILKDTLIEARNLTAENGVLSGDIIMPITGQTGFNHAFVQLKRRNSIFLVTGAANAFVGQNFSTGVTVQLAAAFWAYRIRAKRSW